jgi:hypothetical protein
VIRRNPAVQHWFTRLLQARTLIATWRRDRNTEQSKQGQNGMTPAAHAQQLTISADLAWQLMRLGIPAGFRTDIP